ncbi:hypothetical protein O181_066142 [Austropuccinia psidii MF-1]|uniref:Secreted protein n=1 Tax=Austropuccinia psidii MF-1 TaxID=1389203 RepID=A0A9Q3EYM1_9BASI|nr:hypothetical protein [Austropuccinia psidii MF-1]
MILSLRSILLLGLFITQVFTQRSKSKALVPADKAKKYLCGEKHPDSVNVVELSHGVLQCATEGSAPKNLKKADCMNDELVNQILTDRIKGLEAMIDSCCPSGFFWKFGTRDGGHLTLDLTARGYHEADTCQ